VNLTDFLNRKDLHKSTIAILKLVHEKTKKEIEFIYDSKLNVEAKVTVARSFMDRHIIFFGDVKEGTIDHLIAHECGHILRYYSVNSEKRMIPMTNNQSYQIALMDLERKNQTMLQRIPPEVKQKIIPFWISGFIQQLTNLPVDYYIETWIFNQYPELQEFQANSINVSYLRASQGLDPQIKKRVPDLLYKGSNAMNYAYFKKLDRVMGTDYFHIYKKFPDKKLGEKLFNLINDHDSGFESDITTINNWADELNVNKWFSWIPFDMNQESNI
jgi:hypothetical protein